MSNSINQFMSDGIDDISPLTGLGSPPPEIFGDGFETKTPPPDPRPSVDASVEQTSTATETNFRKYRRSPDQGQ